MPFATYIAALLLMLVAAVAAAQGPTQPFTYEANEQSARIEGGEQVITLNGSVRITQGSTVITAGRAIAYEASKRVELIGSVVVRQPGTTIYAPRIDYNGFSKVATAPNGVRIVESDGANIYGTWGQYDVSRRHASFRNGVELKDDDGVLRAASGDYYSVEARADFRGNVRIDSDSASITAENITHWRNTEETFATGNVVLVPKKRDSRLLGDTMRHYPRRGYTIATGSPRLIDVDTARNETDGTVTLDTTIINARVLEAFRADGSEEYVATDQVRMRRSKLQAVGSIARYLPDQEVVGLGSNRPVPVDTAPPDSTTSAGSDTAAVTGSPPIRSSTFSREPGDIAVVWYEQAQLSGDTITVFLENDKLRTMTATGDAFAADEADGPERYNQFAGIQLYLDVLHDTVRQVRSEGDAASLFFKYDDEQPDGLNRASGDAIRINFEQGDVRRVAVLGPKARPEGEYVPEPMVAGREVRYRLDGFRWFERDPYAASLNGIVPKPKPAPTVKLPDRSELGE